MADYNASTDDNILDNLELPPLPEEPAKKEKPGLFSSIFSKKANSKKQAPPPVVPPPSEELSLPGGLEKIAAPPKAEPAAIVCTICKQVFKDKKALKSHMNQIHPGGIKYALVLRTGDKIKSMDDLKHLIKYVDDDTFAYHISKTNEFADWIENVIGDKSLAEKFRMAKTKVDAIRVLYGKDVRSSEEVEQDAAEHTKAKEEEASIQPVDDYESLIPKEEQKKPEQKKQGFFGRFRKERLSIKKAEHAIAEEHRIEERFIPAAPELSPLTAEDEAQKVMNDNASYIEKKKKLMKILNEISKEKKSTESNNKSVEEKLKRVEALNNDIEETKKELYEREKAISTKEKELSKSRISKEDLKEIKKNLPQLKKEYNEAKKKLERLNSTEKREEKEALAGLEEKSTMPEFEVNNKPMPFPQYEKSLSEPLFLSKGDSMPLKKTEEKHGFLGMFRKETKKQEAPALTKSTIPEMPKNTPKEESIPVPQEESVQQENEIAEDTSSKIESIIKREARFSEKNKQLKAILRDITLQQNRLKNDMNAVGLKKAKLEASQIKLEETKRAIEEKKKEVSSIVQDAEKFKVGKDELKELKDNLPRLKKEYSALSKQLSIAQKKLFKADTEYNKKSPKLKEWQIDLEEREEKTVNKEAELEEKKNHLMEIQYKLMEEKNRLEEERFDLYIKNELKKSDISSEKIFSPEQAPEEETAPAQIFERQKAPEQPRPQPRPMLTEVPDKEGKMDFRAEYERAYRLSKEGDFKSAYSLMDALEAINKKDVMPEAERRERSYKLLELKTDIKLMSLKSKIN